MSKEALVILFGALVGLMPYLGLPGSWRTVLLSIAGLVIVLLGILLRREVLSRGDTRSNSFFIDNRPQELQKSVEDSAPQERIQ